MSKSKRARTISKTRPVSKVRSKGTGRKVVGHDRALWGEVSSDKNPTKLFGPNPTNC